MPTLAAQRRTVRVLVTSQVLAAMGVSSGIAVGGLLARSLLPSDALAGFAQAGVTLGAALAAVPVARLMARRGRRPGLSAAYAAAALGARARALALVVWATTVGAALGPNLAGPADAFAAARGLPAYGGPFVLSAVAFALAGLVVVVLLRPDPLVLAGGAHAAGTRHGHAPLRHSLAVVLSNPAARTGLAGMTVGQVVMVAVMTMTPLQMRHASADLRLVGFVISVHILGMYALSPLTGLAADRWGRRPLVAAGAATLLGALAIAGSSPGGHVPSLSLGLFLLGLGWNATLVGGSTLLVDALPAGERAAAQGVADMVMTGSGGLGGAASGFVMVGLGYAGLNVVAAVLAGALLVALLASGVRRQTAGP